MRLPRREEIASASGVSEGTADLAYRYLQKEGLLKFQHGRGTFVTAPPMPELPPLYQLTEL